MKWKKLTALILAAMMLFQQGMYQQGMEAKAAGSSEDPANTDEMPEEAYQDAKESFAALIADHDVYALLYQCESYDIRETPAYDATPKASILTGHQVRLTGIEFTDGQLWYQAEAMIDGISCRGYIEDAYLISADEELNGWKDSLYSFHAPDGQVTPSCGTERAARAGKTDINAFPASYRPYIQALIAAHPNWTFVPMNTNLSWNTVIQQEMVPARNLVPLDSMESWKMSNQILSAPYWVQASEAIVRYYMDPRNFLNEDSVFQFEMLSFNSACHTEAGVKAILKNTFMENRTLENGLSYSQNFMQIGKTLNVSPYHLASRVRQEQGVDGSSPLISGTYPGYEGYYNFYNIQASGTTYEEIIRNGLQEAKNAGWTTRYAALYGGSQKVCNNYIKVGQNTLYLQKFDVDGSDGNLYWHQYMQNLLAADNEGKSVRRGYANMGVLNNPFLFRVPVYNNMTASACKMPMDALATPSLSITVSNYDKITLKWGEIAGAQGYEVYRSSKPDTGYKKVSVITSGGITSWTDTVGIDKTYYYKVRSCRNYNGIGVFSSYSSVKKATTKIPAPQIESLSLSSYRKIKVRWTKANGVTGYRIYRKTGKSGAYRAIKKVKGANTITYTDDSVLPNNTYYYKVRAYKTVKGKEHHSSYSREKAKSAKLATPVLTSVSLSGNKDMTLEWGKEKWVKGYRIYRADSAKGKYKLVKTIDDKNKQKFTDKPLSANGTYYYKIRTYVIVNGSKKFSSYSNIILGTTRLSKPTVRSASAISPTKAKLSWKKTAAAQGYQIYRADSYNGKYSKVRTISKGSSLSCTDTGLTPNKTYFYKVRAYSTVNKTTKYSKFSSIACITPRLEEPEIKSVTKISTDKVKISWKKADNAQGYRLYRATSQKGPYKPVGNTSGSSYTDTGLSKGKTYYYKVRAYVKASGSYRYSGYSDIWSVQTRK